MATIHYVISDVSPSDQPERILFATVHKVDLENMCLGLVPFPIINGNQWTRKAVAEAIGNGKVFYTVVDNKLGAEVETYDGDENGVPYLRTAGNSTIQDNLEEL